MGNLKVSSPAQWEFLPISHPLPSNSCFGVPNAVRPPEQRAAQRATCLATDRLHRALHLCIADGGGKGVEEREPRMQARYVLAETDSDTWINAHCGARDLFG
jgi:hypothetical protein